MQPTRRRFLLLATAGAVSIGAGMHTLGQTPVALAAPASATQQLPASATQRLRIALDLQTVAAERQSAILTETTRIFAERLAALGHADAAVLPDAEDAVAISLPADADLPEVTATLHGRGLVEFRERAEDGVGWKPLQERDASGELRTITSAYFVRRSHVVVDPRYGQPQVSFELDDEGAQLFEAATQRLLRQPLTIFYDDRLLTAPIIQSVIRREGVIAGLERAEAHRLAIQINSGALPVHVRIE